MPMVGGRHAANRIRQVRIDDDGVQDRLAKPTTGRSRGRTKIFFPNASKDDHVEYAADEYGDEDHESVKQRLEFRERHQMPVGYDFKGTFVYTIFLSFFLYHTLAGRSQAYYFTQYARDVADVDKFMEIDDPIKYRDWLEYRFLPGMHWNGIDRSTGGTPSIVVVGPPRLRTVRAKSAFDGLWKHDPNKPDHPPNCGHAEEMDGMPVLCFDLSSDEHESGSMDWFENITIHDDGSRFWAAQTVPDHDATACTGTANEAAGQGSPEAVRGSTDCAEIFAASESKGSPSCPAGCAYDADVYLEYQSKDQTLDQPYSSYSGIEYPAGGFLVRNIQKLFRNPPTLDKPGSELFPWPHKAIDAQELLDAGLLHPATRVIFHDYTVYSGTKDAYVNVRLTMEMGLDHGMFIPSRHVRLVRLTEWPEYEVAFEVLFYLMLLLLAFENVWFFVTQVFGAEEALEEALELARFELRYQILQQAAFKNTFAYRPKVLMKQVENKVRKVKAERSHHIAALNKLGCRISTLHERFQRLANTDADLRTTGQKPEEKAVAVLEVLHSFELLKERVVDLNTVKKTSKSPIAVAKRLRIRFHNAFKVVRADTWRVLDMINYGFFFITFVIRLKINPLMDKALDGIASINREDPYADSEYVQLYELTFWALILTYAYAVNAVLTWLKVFKFFSYFPSMQILTRTLAYAAAPLGSFSVILVVVLIAFGQAFFLSFGLDLWGYRTFNTSVFALLRMAVGDFDYVALEQSHRMLGPALFWMYIFLVFFILMSVFIALISEAYEKAKEELEDVADAAQQSVVVDDPLRTLDEARHRLDSVAAGLVSPAMLASMKECLPREQLKRSTSFRDQVSKKIMCGKSEKEKWRNGPLAGEWNHEPVDLFTNDGHEWVHVNDLRDFAGYQAEQNDRPVEKPARIKPGLLVCKISNPLMKGTVLKREGWRACVDFQEGENLRSGLASISNLLGAANGEGGGLKSALSRAMSRASEVHKKHPTDWTEDDVVKWATDSKIPSVAEVADNFKEHGVNGKCLLHLDRADLKDIGVEKVADLKVALVQIRQLSKIPKQVTMDHTLDKNTGKKRAEPRPPGSKIKLPGQVSFVGESNDDMDMDIDEEEIAGADTTVHEFLLNRDSKWVKFTRGDLAFYQNTSTKGLNSLKMPREGIRGERVLDESSDNERSFKKNYDKAKRMDEMKARAQLEENGGWGSLMKKGKAEQVRSAESTG